MLQTIDPGDLLPLIFLAMYSSLNTSSNQAKVASAATANMILTSKTILVCTDSTGLTIQFKPVLIGSVANNDIINAKKEMVVTKETY